VAPFKHFSGVAIGLALALWGLCRQSAAAVRRRVSDRRPHGDGEPGWPTLRRWATDAGRGRLFGSLGLAPLPGPPLAVARRVAQALCGCGAGRDCGLTYEAQACAGAGHVA
jgi:hypothetical protein